MTFVLNAAASGCMLVFVALLAWRGLSQLGWLPAAARRPGRPAGPVRAGAEASARELALWAVLAVALEWGFIAFGWAAAGRGEPFLEWFWQRFTTAGDAEHYLYLAQYGYARAGDQVNCIVFYPLYPLAIRVVGLFTGDFALAAVLISQSCWAAAAAALRRLAGRLVPSRQSARCAVLALVLFPFSFFSMGIFTESLFLLLTVLALDAVVCGRWRAAGVAGFLAALCRTQGVLLVLAAAFAWLAACPTAAEKRRQWRGALWCLAPLAGYGLYLWLNRLYCGSAGAFLYYQSIAPWYQHAQWVGRTIGQQWQMIQDYPGLARFIYWPQMILYFAAMALLLAGLAGGAPVPLLLYGGAYIGASYLSSWLISGSRYTFGCAPLYLMLPYLPRRWMRWAVLALEGAALALYVTYYMQGQAIM